MSAFIDKLRQGQPQLGLCVMYPAPGIVERIGPDWDWIWIDGQHGQHGYQDVMGLVRACNLIQRPAFVRVPGHERGLIGLALDSGADAVIVPQVESVADAQAIVTAAKFPPLGQRSYGGRRPVDLHGRTYSDTANTEILLVAQIESPQAIDAVDAIAAVPGIDALFLGPDDIMIRRGYAMTAPRNKDTLGKDMEAVTAACRRHGKIACTVGFGADMLSLSVSTGFQLIVSGGDVAFLASTSTQASKDARATLKGVKPPAPATGGTKGPSSPY